MDDRKRTSSDPLQVLREGVAVVISMVILGLAAWTIGMTFLSARGDSVDAYNREKDIMLYVVSLFGTVTGYYLGRVPAEVNARRAETAANAAQQQLAQSQEKLGLATAEATTARVAGAQASKRLSKTTGELRNASEAIARVRRAPRPALGGAAGIRADDDGPDAGEGGLLEVKRRIDTLLAQMADDDGLA
jgi:ABC-type multidrug transport system fused ATPase/permease subunit